MSKMQLSIMKGRLTAPEPIALQSFGGGESIVAYHQQTSLPAIMDGYCSLMTWMHRKRQCHEKPENRQL